MSNPVVVIGGDAVAAGDAPVLRQLAMQRRVGMFNTFAAKGLFAWNDPAHLGTIGLQADDLDLAGISDTEVLLVGVSDDEIGRDWLRSVGALWRDVTVAELDASLVVNEVPTPRPALYEALAAVCGPMYTSDAVPMNPARAAADLAAWLPDGGVVQARRDVAGFWLGRTLPTRTLGSIRFGPDSAQHAAIHIVSDHPTADHPTADHPHADHPHADHPHNIVEVWSADGPLLTAGERIARLQRAIEGRDGAVLQLGIDVGALDAFVAVAGRPLWPRLAGFVV